MPWEKNKELTLQNCPSLLCTLAHSRRRPGDRNSIGDQTVAESFVPQTGSCTLNYRTKGPQSQVAVDPAARYRSNDLGNPEASKKKSRTNVQELIGIWDRPEKYPSRS